MAMIFDDIRMTDVDDNEHECRVRIDYYQPYLRASSLEPPEEEEVEWVFCDERGEYIAPPFEIGDREERRIDEMLMERIRDIRSAGDEP